MEIIKCVLFGVKQFLYSDDVNIFYDYFVVEVLSEDMFVNIFLFQVSEIVLIIKQMINSICSVVRKVEVIFFNLDKNNKVNDYWLSIKDKIVRDGISDIFDCYCFECVKGIDVLINSVIFDVKWLIVE